MVKLPAGPGVGKSRLLYELIQSASAQRWRILETGGVPYGAGMSYLPVIALLKTYLGIDDRATPHAVAENLRRTVLRLDRALEPILPALASLLDAPIDDRGWSLLDPPERRRRTLEGVKRLLVRLSHERPLLLVCEDLHWIDAETQALLDSLVESLTGARLALFVTYRPEYEHHWTSKSQYGQMRLETLRSAGAEELLEALLGGDASLGPLKTLLTGRATGNPLFLEESVRALVDNGVLGGERGAYYLAKEPGMVQVPPTIQAILETRIDRLPAEAKHVLQTAAVIGKEASLALLLATTELSRDSLHRNLAHLHQAELLYETTLFPDSEYAFKHALIQEVAYGSLLHARRRELHARIVAALESLHRDRLGEQIERLAYHAVRGEVWDKAVPYLRQAGLKATARSALMDARNYLEQALDAVAALPENESTLKDAFEIRLDLRTVLALLGEVRQTAERLREAEILAERLNDDRRRGRVCAFMTNIHYLFGELDEAVVSGDRALAIARMLGGIELGVLATSMLEHVYYLQGEYARVVELATDNLAGLSDDFVYQNFRNAVETSLYDRCWLVMSLAQLGSFEGAARYESEVIGLAEPARQTYALAIAHRAAAILHLLKGDWAQARSLIERWISSGRSGNLVVQVPIAIASFAWVLAQLREPNEALNRLGEGQRFLEDQAARGIIGHLAWGYHALGRAALLLGRLEEARSLGDRAIEFSPHHPGFVAHALHLLGDIASDPECFDASRGEAHYRQALALAEPRGMRPLVAHCHLGLGKLYRRTDKRERAQEHLATATTMYRVMGMTYWLEKAEAEVRELG